MCVCICESVCTLLCMRDKLVLQERMLNTVISRKTHSLQFHIILCITLSVFNKHKQVKQYWILILWFAVLFRLGLCAIWWVTGIFRCVRVSLSLQILTNASSDQSVQMDAAGTQKDLSDVSVAKATPCHLLEISVKVSLGTQLLTNFTQ